MPRAPSPEAVEETRAIRADLALNVNGHERRVTVDTRLSLLDVLRDHLALTGAKAGCDRGHCGCCTVLVDGRRVYSCLTLAVACGNARVLTVEGLGGEQLHPLQRAFGARDAFQCGFCTPGQLCSAIGMLDEIARGRPGPTTAGTPSGRSARPPTLTAPEVRERMSGNLCRCGAYQNIVAAILDAAS
ncbi:(2Fe-2S)-binding protein [Streptomyces sp. NPDC101733]|uniref:(2Fe-2S)-binding protein n=1 Tax=unclassified Streptomyces TaxID=2593676 RepID=UPI003810CABD